jgi:hypothetical protein
VLWFQQGRRKKGKRTEETLRLFFFLPLLSFDYYGQTTRRPIIKHTHTQGKKEDGLVCARSATCVTVSYVCVCTIHTGVQLLSILRFFFVFFFRLFCFYLGGETRHLPPDG